MKVKLSTLSLLCLVFFLLPQNLVGQHVIEETSTPDGRPIEIMGNGTWRDVPILMEHAFTDFMSNDRLVEIFANHTWREINTNVSIGTQVWKTKNLNVTHFRDGTAITYAKSVEEWKNADSTDTPAYCYYNFNEAYEPIYGKLYNMHAVIDQKELAPEGYRVANYSDYQILSPTVDENETSKLKSISGWNLTFDGNNSNGTNESGFNAFPGGYIHIDGTFSYVGNTAMFWSLDPTSSIINVYVIPDSGGAWMENMGVSTLYSGIGSSVRCIKE